MTRRSSTLKDIPDRVDYDVREVWLEVVGRGRVSPIVTAEMLEAYCTLVIRHRQAAERVEKEGLVVDGGERRGAVVHPALAVERQLADQLRTWAPLVNRAPSPRRRSGPMYDATRRSIEADTELAADDRFEGACAAVLTLAWLIDEAQRDGIEALQKATFNLIPSYLKGCAELQITPASLPEDTRKKVPGGGKVSKFQDAANKRRLGAVG